MTAHGMEPAGNDSARTKILHVTGFAHAGAGRHVLELIQGCDSSRFAMTVALAAASPMLTQIRATGHTVVPLPIDHGGRPWPNLKAFFQLLELIRGGGFDLVHTHTSVAGAIGRVAASMCEVPTVHTLHTLATHEHLRGWKRRAARFVERFLDRLTDRYVSPALSLSRQGIAEGVLSPEKIVNISHGIDIRAIDRFAARAHSTPLAGESNAARIGLVGRLDPVKGGDLFLEAAIALQRELPTARFVFCGSGTAEEPLRASAQRRGFADRCQFLGWREDVWAVMRDLDVVVIPSRREPFGLVATEAMALRKPVIATNVGGLAEIVEDGQTGLLVPPEDVAALSQAILTLVNDADRRRKMGLAGRLRVERFFTFDRMIAAHEELYESLVLRRSFQAQSIPARRAAA